MTTFKTPRSWEFLDFFLSGFLEFAIFIAVKFKLRGKVAAVLRARYAPPPSAGGPNTRPRTGKTVLIHCASGEFEYAKPVIREIKLQFPDSHVLVTFLSESYRKSIEKDPLVDWAGPLPFHSLKKMRVLLDHFKPDRVLIARTDIWPNLVFAAREQGIRIGVFSATLPRASEGRLPFLASVGSRFRFSGIDKIASVNPPSQKWTENSTDCLIQVLGDSRYDQVLHRLKQARPLPSKLLGLTPSRVWVLGSTWPEDESALWPTIRFVVTEKNFTVILVPHEPTKSHIAELTHHCSQDSLRYELWSVMGSEPRTTATQGKVLLVDQVGWLADLYPLADWAFVGGSFRGSVHSVMEPLAAGCRTLVGPFHQNNAEALEFLKLEPSPIKVVQSARDAAGLLDDEGQTGKWPTKDQIQKEIQARSGASKRIVRWMLGD